MSGLFILNSVLLGVGLAMDAFSVSLANGLANHFLRLRTMCLIAGTFGFFQWLMPMAGWVCVNRIVDLFQVLLPLVPWASLVLLVAIGGLMIRDGLSGEEEDVKVSVGLRYRAAPGARDLHGRALRRLHIGRVPLRQSDARKYHHRHRDLRHLHRRALPRETLRHEARG